MFVPCAVVDRRLVNGATSDGEDPIDEVEC